MKTIALPIVCFLLGFQALLADTQAPLITAASVVPGSANVAGASVNVTATFTITDNSSGFRQGFIYLINQAGNFVDSVQLNDTHRISGDPLNGVYVTQINVPRYGAPGTWRLSAYLYDVADNVRFHDTSSGSTPFPVPEDVEINVINTGDADILGPGFTTASVSPNVADVTTSPATLTFTIECGDALSGFTHGFVYPKDPSGTYRNDLTTFFSRRTSGDETSGTYEVAVTFPQGSQAGEWSYEFSLRDRVGNISFVDNGGTFTLINTPPASNATFLAHALDAVQLPFTTSGAGWVIGSAETHDGIDSAVTRPTPDAGESVLSTTVTGPGTLRFFWRTSSALNEDVLSVDVPSASIRQEISGDTAWQEVVLTLPGGTHVVDWTYAKDESGASFQDRAWIDEVAFFSSTDSETPRLHALRVSPSRIDTQALVPVTVTMEITDDFNGCESGTVSLYNPPGGLAATASFDQANRVSGDMMAGRYEVEFNLAAGATEGIWKVAVMLTDNGTESTRLYGPGNEPFPLAETEKFFVGNSNPIGSEPPTLRKMEFLDDSVDVSTGDAPVFLTLHVTDLPEGMDEGEIFILRPDGGRTGRYNLTRVAGDAFNGIYQADAAVPRYGSPGTWSVGVGLSDYNTSVEHPFGEPFPSGIDPEIQVSNTGAVDTAMPYVSSIAIDPAFINTATAPAEIEVTVTLGDALSGVVDSFAYVEDPDGLFRGEYLSVLDSSNRISGDEMDGTYQFTLTLPVGSKPGNWRIKTLVRDRTGLFQVFGTVPDPYPSGSGIFTVNNGGGNWFDSKMAQYFLTGPDALPGADPDKDGKSNAEESAAGSNPNLADSVAFTTVSRTTTHLYLSFNLPPTITVGTSGQYLTLSEGGLQPMRLTGEIQNGLSGVWTRVLPELVSGNTWRIGIPLSGGPRGFARLRFENP